VYLTRRYAGWKALDCRPDRLERTSAPAHKAEVMDIKVTESSDGPVKVIIVGGRLDGATAPGLGERLSTTLGASNQRLLLELSELEYISSAGFRVLLLAAKRAKQSDGEIVLSGVVGPVRQLFEIGGFLNLFRICETRDEGVSLLR
jgi:anti-anti-sigma factor